MQIDLDTDRNNTSFSKNIQQRVTPVELFARWGLVSIGVGLALRVPLLEKPPEFSEKVEQSSGIPCLINFSGQFHESLIRVLDLQGHSEPQPAPMASSVALLRVKF